MPSNTPNGSPPPAKKTPKKRVVKREKPNIYTMRDNFVATDTNEYVVDTADEVKVINDFRLFTNTERTRGVAFDFNKFIGRDGKEIKNPTVWMINHWEEKKENIKHPETDDGHRETAARFKPHEIPIIEEAFKAIKLLNPAIFNNMKTHNNFKAEDFINRVAKKGIALETARADVEDVTNEGQQ